MERFEGACTDWTSYVEINRPNWLILGRFAEKQGANRFGRLILTIRDFMAITALSVLIVKKWAQIPTYFVIDSFGTTIPPGKGFAHAC
jgi:hypothetical protein